MIKDQTKKIQADIREIGKTITKEFEALYGISFKIQAIEAEIKDSSFSNDEKLRLDREIDRVGRLLRDLGWKLQGMSSRESHASSSQKPHILSAISMDTIACPECKTEIRLILRWKEDGKPPNKDNMMIEFSHG
jgi:hypothetical protein